MAQASTPDDPWFVQAFDRTWLRLYPHRDDAEAAAAAPSICKHLGVTTGHSVLDVGCGAGRYARALAARGLRVTGVDLSESLLAVAREKGPPPPEGPTYERHDSRTLPFTGQFDAAMSMFTSFGYFDRRDEDLAIFQGVHRALKPGGRLLVDFMNAEQVRATLVPSEAREQDGLAVAIERRIGDGPSGPSVFKRVEARDTVEDREVASFEERVRLYTPDEVDALLEEAGFTLQGERMGDVHGAAFTATSPRFVRRAERA